MTEELAIERGQNWTPIGGQDCEPFDSGERVLEEGVLSKTSKYRILVSGEIGQKEIEILIRRLEISKESLAGGGK